MIALEWRFWNITEKFGQNQELKFLKLSYDFDRFIFGNGEVAKMGEELVDFSENR